MVRSLLACSCHPGRQKNYYHMITTNPVRYASGGRSCIIWFYLFFIHLFGWENRLISMGGLISVIVCTFLDTFDILDTFDTVVG